MLLYIHRYILYYIYLFIYMYIYIYVHTTVDSTYRFKHVYLWIGLCCRMRTPQAICGWEIHQTWKFEWENYRKIMSKSILNGGLQLWNWWMEEFHYHVWWPEASNYFFRLQIGMYNGYCILTSLHNMPGTGISDWPYILTLFSVKPSSSTG